MSDAQTLRQIRRRKTFAAQTLIRLMLASGVKAKDIVSLPQKNKSALSDAQLDWHKLGATLTDLEKQEFGSLIKTVKKSWKMK